MQGIYLKKLNSGIATKFKFNGEQINLSVVQLYIYIFALLISICVI